MQASVQTINTIQHTEDPRTIQLKIRPKTKVRWTEDVVDNEFMNKKKSKKCCIYHKKRAFDESSSDESGSEDDHECDHDDHDHDHDHDVPDNAES